MSSSGTGGAPRSVPLGISKLSYGPLASAIAPAESIGHRMFVDIYDVWPQSGEPAHYRVGNRRPFGIGDQRQIVASDAGDLWLGINDDHLPDNQGRFRVRLTVR